MIAFRQILCPVDFSEFSRHAIDHAVAIAQWYGGTVTALHVMHPIPYADPLMASAIVFTPEDLERSRRDLAQFIAQETSHPVNTVVVQGTAAPTIVHEAATMPADLIVLGTHGRSGFEHLMLGSVTERVLRKAPCPVLTVPHRMPDVVEVGPVMFHRILCAVDFSPSSMKALTYAASLAKETGAQLTVMHVVEPVPVYEPVLAGGGGSDVNADESARQAGLARIREVSPRGVLVSEVVATGKPYREILARAREEHSDLLVIGVHGGLADRLHFGSTTNHVIREATCPVLSLRA
jgi:nucleotide-binding universal stress UspA family protein